jgi:Fe-S cluster assembly protein SufD
MRRWPNWQLGDGAVLHYHQIQEESPQAFHLGGIRLNQERDSQAHLHLLSFGGQLARTDLEALLDGEGASCTLNGLTLARDQQFSDYPCPGRTRPAAWKQ